MKNVLLLGGGIIITLLFVIFSTEILEALYYEREFSNEMYNLNVYFIVSIIQVAFAWIMGGIYYYAINSVSFSRWFHWLLTLCASAVISSFMCNVYVNSVFSDLQLSFSNQLFSFSIILFFVELVLFTIVSFSIRWWSSNCRHTPIPE